MDYFGYIYSEINLFLVYIGNIFDFIIILGFESLIIGFGDFDNDYKFDILWEGNVLIIGGGMVFFFGVFVNCFWLY